MPKEEIPPTLESLKSEIDDLEYELDQAKSKIDDLEGEIKDLKAMIYSDAKSDIEEIFTRLNELESRG